MSLRTINQNLLPILHALLRERSVTRAAQRVGLSQPAVSKALIQLRGILGDEVLVRSGRGLVLTRRAEALIGPVTALCEELERFWRPEVFDPARSRREFVIAGTDYCAMLMVPAMADVLNAQAPGVSMRFVDVVPQQLIEERTEIDFAMVPDVVVPAQFREHNGVMPLFADEFVTIAPTRRRLTVASSPDADNAAALRSISFGNDNPLVSRHVRENAALGPADGRPLAVVEQFLTMPLLAMLTGAVTVVPRRLLALLAANLSVEVLEDVAPQGRVEMVLAWHQRHEGDAEHLWFRKLVAQQLRGDRFW